MTKTNNHNTLYFLTTISVYLGLVFVGASPQALSYSKTAQSSQPHSFEINVKSNSVFSKLKFESDSEGENVLPFAVFGAHKKPAYNGNSNREFVQVSNLHAEINAANNQVLIITNLPRASI